MPDLLAVEEPETHFPEICRLRCRIDYEFLPPTVISRFMVDHHRLIEDKLRWRTGMVLADAYGARALIRADKTKKRVLIGLHGGKSIQSFLARIRTGFDQINHSFKKNRIQQKIACNCPKCAASTEPHFHGIDELMDFYVNGYDAYPCPLNKEMVAIPQLLNGVKSDADTEIMVLLKQIKTNTDPKFAQKKRELLSEISAHAGLLAPPVAALLKNLLG